VFFVLGDWWISVGIACLVILYLVFDGLMYALFFSGPGMLARLLEGDLYFVGTRATVLCLFLIFGSHAQYTIDERRKAEEVAKTSETKYKTIVESIDDGYFEIDSSGHFTFFNESMCEILDCSMEEIGNVDSRLLKLDDIPDGALEDLEDTGSVLLEQRRDAKTLSSQFTRNDGSRRFLETSVSPMRDSQGRQAGFRGITRDVTETRQANELLQARRIAEAANRAKSQFLAHMSHEIRTPLNAVLGFIELVLEDPLLPVHQKKHLITAQISANSLLGLINDILDVSKLESGKLTLEKRPFNLRKLVGEIYETVVIRAQEKGLKLELDIQAPISEAYIGDPLRLRQIIANLVSNAIKFTEGGSVAIRVAPAEEQPQLHFMVEDTGIGIPASRLECLL